MAGIKETKIQAIMTRIERLKNKLLNTEAVIFDLDGTLVDSMWIWKSIDEEFLGMHGLALPHDLQKSLGGMSFTETAVYFKERFRLTQTLEEIKDCWNAMAFEKYEKEVPLKPGVKEFLDVLKQRGIRMGIATSNSRQLAELVIVSRGISGYFEVITTGCEVASGKPSPDIYLKTAKHLSANPSACVVFEDIPEGILAAKRAGMCVCAVEDEASKELRQEKYDLADAFINNYYEIL